jgi:hypothetical protein
MTRNHTDGKTLGPYINCAGTATMMADSTADDGRRPVATQVPRATQRHLMLAMLGCVGVGIVILLIVLPFFGPLWAAAFATGITLLLTTVVIRVDPVGAGTAALNPVMVFLASMSGAAAYIAVLLILRQLGWATGSDLIGPILLINVVFLFMSSRRRRSRRARKPRP